MSEEFIARLANVKNPVTKETLVSEGRILGCSVQDDILKIKYNREGISPEQKRLLEDEIYEALKGLWDENKIQIMTISDSSKDILGDKAAPTQSKPQGEQAGLKVGHGTIGTPKKINDIKKIIAVASGKGGVGKSTFTVNLACTLANMGYKVGVIDADIYGPSIPMMMGVRSEKPLSGEDKKIVPIEKHGVKMMSFGFFIDEKDPVIWRGPMLGGVLSQFLFDVKWGELDYLILDLPPGTGDIQLSMIQNVEVDGAIVISTPQDVALLDAVKALEMFKKLKLPILGMVENMAYFVCGKCEDKHYLFGSHGVEKGAKEFGEKFLGEIPLEMAVREGADSGIPYMSTNKYEGRAVWQGYTEVAKSLTGGDNKPKKGFLKNIFG